MHNHISPKSYLSVAAVDFGGGTMRWFRDTAGYKTYKEIDGFAAQAEPGNDGLLFLPYMVGQRSPLYNDNMNGVVFGLKPSHDKRHISRMFMEGTAYAVRNVIGYFRDAGANPVHITMTGGVSRSKVWSQIMADIVGLDIDVPDTEDVACVGIAAAAGVAVGMYKDLNDALGGRIPTGKYTPDKNNVGVYQRGFAIFKKVLEGNLPLFEYAKNT
jgi:xylulokinase